MRNLSLAFLLISIVCASCTARIPAPPGLKISVRAEARVEARANVRARVPEPPPPPPPPAPAPAVALDETEVVEFFGIPLDNAQEVVFVLDRSGSMAEAARGRIAVLGAEPSPMPPPPQAEVQTVVPASHDALGEPPVEDGSAEDQAAPEAEPNEPPVEDGSTEEQLAPEAEPSAPPQAAATSSAPPPIPSKLDVAHRELVAALARLPAGTRVNVLYFSHELEAFAATLFVLEDANRAELVEFVTATFPTGATALGPAMRTAFLMNARRIILLSDGLGNVGGGSYAVLRDAREAIRGGVRIDTIGLGRSDSSLLRALANESGGLYQGL